MYDLIDILRYEKQNNIRNGLYGLTQRSMAYNSNKIEGSTLDEEDTLTLFNEGVIYKKDMVVSKHIEEMTGHFAMFNSMLNNCDKELNEDIIKEYHKMLKQGVFEDIANGNVIGDYKKRPNVVGKDNMKTSQPNEVNNKMKELLNWYTNIKDINVGVIANFHEKYEKIHPFQDGNGRTGRIIIFKECLKNNVFPIIIQDKNKKEYYKGLEDAHNGNLESLINYFRSEQNWYKEWLKHFEINTGLFEKNEETYNLLKNTVNSTKNIKTKNDYSR